MLALVLTAATVRAAAVAAHEAAHWVAATREPGLYDMVDVLGLTDLV